MFKVLAIIIVGVFIGRQIRSDKAPTILSKSLNVVIYLLLLVMGISVGGNEDIVNNLSTLGLQSLIIMVGAMLGSVIFASIIYSRLFKKRE